MLLVMDLHNLTGNGGLEGVESVRQVGQCRLATHGNHDRRISESTQARPSQHREDLFTVEYLGVAHKLCQLSQSVMTPSIHASDDVEGPMDWDRWKAVYHKVARSVRRVSMQEHRERSPHRRPGRSAPLAVIAWATMYPLRVGTGGGGASSSRRIPRSTPASSSSETQRHHPLAHAPICRCSRSLAMIGAHPRRYLQRGGNS